MFLAYIDIRSFLYIVGLLLFAALSLLVCWATKARFRNRNVVLFSALLFTGLFTFFLTGLGPFIDHKEIREYPMSWEIKPNPSDRTKEAEVVLSFVDFPGYYVGEYSDELAAYLRERGEQPVKVVFEVTTDYRKVRGFNEIEIAGLRSWRSQPGYAGVGGSPGNHRGTEAGHGTRGGT